MRFIIDGFIIIAIDIEIIFKENAITRGILKIIFIIGSRQFWI